MSESIESKRVWMCMRTNVDVCAHKCVCVGRVSYWTCAWWMCEFVCCSQLALLAARSSDTWALPSDESLKEAVKDSAGLREGGGQLCAKRTLKGGAEQTHWGHQPPGFLDHSHECCLLGSCGVSFSSSPREVKGSGQAERGAALESNRRAEIPALPPDTKSCGWAV